jgi:predicted nucleotidyltransferase
MTDCHSVLGKAKEAAIAKRLDQEGSLDAAYLLGSAASNALRHDSDVDIALLPARGKSIVRRRLMSLAADLESIIGWPVDLGVLHTGNLVYAKEALTSGRLIFERDSTYRQQFAMLGLSMYAELQENRREVLNAYAA